MKDFKAIISEYRKVNLSERKAALATVVRVRGSSYRSPGARMLITDDGRWVGSISGGCLEGDALRKARQVMIDQRPVTVTYDTNEESNQNLGIGLGCNGVIDVLIEPILPHDEHNPLRLFEQFANAKSPLVLATIFTGRRTGEKLLTDGHDKVYSEFQDRTLNDFVRNDLRSVMEIHKSEVKVYEVNGEQSEVFLELIQPTLSLIIFGGGVDARPVSRLASSLGWDVAVTDECVAHIAPSFFPGADKLSLCQRDFIDRDFDITPYTACVLMSHNYEYDRDVLRKLLPTPAPYIGIMGPLKRFTRMIDELSRSGITLREEDYRRIHAPIGLDIGAEAADEIAVAIIAEIQSKFSNRTGGYLRSTQGPIHQRDETDQVYKQPYLVDKR